VRSHYGKNVVPDGEKIYRAANALGNWLGLSGGWIDIVAMQGPENIDEFRRMLKKAV
jgi:hypothetical protein